MSFRNLALAIRHCTAELLLDLAADKQHHPHSRSWDTGQFNAIVFVVGSLSHTKPVPLPVISHHKVHQQVVPTTHAATVESKANGDT